jgi:hypothetical protein
MAELKIRKRIRTEVRPEDGSKKEVIEWDVTYGEKVLSRHATQGEAQWAMARLEK